MRTKILIITIFMVFLAECTIPSINTPSLTYTYIFEKTSTIVPTKPLFPIFTQTPTQIPSKTPTITTLSTRTSLPTLEPTAVVLYVENLLKNNAGCRLPCWWGITPGKTTWIEAQQFLNSFARLLGITGNPSDSGYASFLIPYPADIGSISHGYRIKNGIIDEIIDLYNGNLTTNYNLVEILNTYGQPDNVLISAYYEPRYSEYMAEVAIFYLHQGILVIYYDNDGVTVGDKIQKCPQKATYPWLNLWSPALNLSIQEAANNFLDMKNWPAYSSLQDATGMSVDTFYNTFKDPKNKSCLELSVSDWPKQ